MTLLAVDPDLEDLLEAAFFEAVFFDGVAFLVAAFFFCAATGVAASAPVEKIPANDARRISDIVGDSKAAHARAGMLIILFSPQSVRFYGRNCRRHTRRRQMVVGRATALRFVHTGKCEERPEQAAHALMRPDGKVDRLFHNPGHERYSRRTSKNQSPGGVRTPGSVTNLAARHNRKICERFSRPPRPGVTSWDARRKKCGILGRLF
ncbi:MAG: hypothetical protein KF868_09490 [Acidobacteria bacterium]|nr:hypothetical protein [Acidobacteriota bacterium]